MSDVRPYTPPTKQEDIAADQTGYFLEIDPELQMAYLACLEITGLQWSDEELAECVYRAKYGNAIDDLMQHWRQKQALINADDPEHARAVAVHLAVKKWQHRQRTAQPQSIAV